MKKLFFLMLLVMLSATLSACQGFFDDYNYAPLGSSAGSNS